MSQPDAPNAACDLRLALAQSRGGICRPGFTPDAAARDVITTDLGPPARPRQGDEPIAVYPQPRGPALCFGAYGSEARVRGWLPGLPALLSPQAVQDLRPIDPVLCQDTAHKRMNPCDLSGLPIPQVTPRDAGRYITMGFVLAADGTLSAHRMLVLGPDRLGIWMLPGRSLRHLAEAAHAQGQDLPVTINIGVPPAVAIAAATSTAALPQPLAKLALAGALAGRAIALAGPKDAPHLAHSEIVLRARILPETHPEAAPGAPLGLSMPEFLGYDGHGQAEVMVVQIDEILARPEAVFQAVIGPGREQSVILGLGGALSLARALPCGEQIHNLRFAAAGGGMLLLYVALDSRPGRDLAGLARSIIALSPFVKTIVFVDPDIDLNCDEDVLWAMTTRAQWAQDSHGLQGYAPLGMDPSQSPAYRAERGGQVFKSYLDATVPPMLKAQFRRAMI
jgi:gallate decarboxylase subunit C